MPFSHPKSTRISAIKAYYRDPNKSLKDIASGYGISHKTLSSWLTQHQLKKHTPKKEPI